MYYFVTLQAVVTSRPDSVVVAQTPLQQQVSIYTCTTGYTSMSCSMLLYSRLEVGYVVATAAQAGWVYVVKI